MVQCRIRTLVVALIAWAGAWATPPPARADFDVTLSAYMAGSNTAYASVTLSSQWGITSSGNVNLVGTSISSSNVQLGQGTTIGDFQLLNSPALFSAENNSPGTSLLAQVGYSTLNLQNGNTTAGETLKVSVSAGGFTAPVGVGTYLTGSVSGTVMSGSGLVSGEVTITASSTMGEAGYTASTSQPFGPAGSGQSFSTNLGTNASGLSSPYTLSIATSYNFGAGADLYVSGAQAQTVVPAPAGLLIALSGAPILGLGCWFGRRRSQGLKVPDDLAVA